MIYLGFDTSNYTTSVACCGDTKLNIRKLLDVKNNERGLRQSDALFQHIKGLPELFGELCEKTDIKKVSAVGVSTSPRRVDNSYMPVFLAGEGYARVCADSLGVPVYEFSHQEGHIMAGVYSSEHLELLKKPFISVHMSGGTFEILLTKYEDFHFNCEIIGKTKDISAGQLIDRTGVKMGFGFPCGKHLEKLSENAKKQINLPVNSENGCVNFSGIETKVMGLIGKEENPDIAMSLFLAISKAFAKSLNYCIRKYNVCDILLVGGVISNSIIRENLKKNVDANLYFSDIEYSTDNAYGTALLAKHYYERNNG